MELRIQVVAVVAALILFGIVLELVRRKRFLERYALTWLFSAFVLFMLALWKGLLESVASAIGIVYPPSALFVIAFGFVLVLLLHFSVAVSRLTDQTKILAQRLALLEERQRDRERIDPMPRLGSVDLPGDEEREPEPVESQRGWTRD
jgi:hypothetical protein